MKARLLALEPGLIVAAAVAGLVVAAAPAAPPQGAGSPESYPQRMVYDPQTGEWIAEPPPEPGTDLGDLELARRALASGSKGRFSPSAGGGPRIAQRQLKQWLKFYGAASELHPEALFLLGRAEFELGNYMNAHNRYREVINGWPGTEWADRATRADFLVAEVLLAGKRRKVLGVPLLTAEDEGIEILDKISTEYANTVLAEEAIKAKADYYFARGEFDFAEDEYARLAREFPAGQHVRYALLRSADAALAQYGGIDFQDKPLVEAEERFDQYRQRFPSSPEDEEVRLIREEITNRRAQKEYQVGRYYRRVKRFRAAAHYFRYVVATWPDTTWAKLAAAELEQIEPFAVPQAETASQPPAQRTPVMEAVPRQ